MKYLPLNMLREGGKESQRCRKHRPLLGETRRSITASQPSSQLRARGCRDGVNGGALNPTSICLWHLVIVLCLVLGNDGADAFSGSPECCAAAGPRRCHSSPLLASSSGHQPNGDASGALEPQVPQHVAFVCDGNSRWAKARNLPSIAGHAAGADRLIKMVTELQRRGVGYCTMYGFSTENWRRPTSEVQGILSVMEKTARGFYHTALQEDLRIRILGDLQDERIPSGLRDILHRLENETGGNDVSNSSKNDGKLTITIAINYGGRQDILNASKQIALALAKDDCVGLDDVTEETFASFLGTAGMPDPDLVIRTSGECRVSNFLLWNIAYSELYFVDTLWPDFDEASLEESFEWYNQRKRRFGAREAEQEPRLV